MNTNFEQLNKEYELLSFKVDELSEVVDSLSKENAELKAKIQYYEEKLRLNASKKFGASSEKTNPDQISFEDIVPEIFPDFDEVEATISESEDPIEEPTIEKATKRRTGKIGSKNSCFDALEVNEIVHELKEEDLTCKICDGPLHEIRREVREEIEIVPVKFIKTRHITVVYGCRNCEKNGTEGSGIIKSEGKIPVIPGSFASSSLIAWIIAKKYWEKMPVYRLEKYLASMGFDISRSNMCNWTAKVSTMYLDAVYQALHKEILKQSVINADETPFRVLQDNGKAVNSQSYMWYYTSGQIEKNQICLYEYQPSRRAEHPKMFLKGFKGTLQTDGYAGYNKIPDVDFCGCMAHAKRKFADAIKSLGKSEQHKQTLAAEGLKFYDKLFSLEKKYPSNDAETRLEMRLKYSGPVVEELKSWLEKTKRIVTPKSGTGEAIAYSINHWEKLTYFMKNGKVEISNNKAERGIKEFVISRKNSLFSSTTGGAQVSGIAFSLVEAAKANGLNPYEYIKYLLDELSQNKQTDEKIQELLPWSDKIPESVKIKRRQ